MLVIEYYKIKKKKMRCLRHSDNTGLPTTPDLPLNLIESSWFLIDPQPKISKIMQRYYLFNEMISFFCLLLREIPVPSCPQQLPNSQHVLIKAKTNKTRFALLCHLNIPILKDSSKLTKNDLMSVYKLGSVVI